MFLEVLDAHWRLNTAQQIGAVLGLALLIAVTLLASDRAPRHRRRLPLALVDGDTALAAWSGDAHAHGYSAALAVEIALVLLAAAVAARALRATPAAAPLVEGTTRCDQPVTTPPGAIRKLPLSRRR